MHVFVTGASGWIGSAVVPELLGAGHQVTGLARSDASAAALTAAGVQVQRGTLDDLDTLRRAAAASDGVIHLAFKHDIAFSGDFQGAADADRRAVEAFGDALAGSGKPFLIASGTLGLSPGRLATEQDGHGDGSGTAAWGSGPETRRGTAELTLSFADRGVRSSVVRLPPTNHGDGDNGFMATLVAIARDKGVAGYIGDGANRWPAVHTLDAARLLCYAALWLRDEQRPHSAEASMSKWYGPVVASAAIKDCLLLHGHYGYAEEFGLEQRLRDVMAVEIADGTAQVQKIVIARERFGRHFVPYRRPPATGQ